MTRLEQLQNAINQSGLPIAQIAIKAKCDRQTIYNYLKGRTDITLSIFDRIIEACRKPV